MAAEGIKSPVVLDELESHLREDVEQRMRGGTSPEQAFHDAALQMGTAGQLQSEFVKLSRPQARLSEKNLRIGCAAIATFVFLTQGWYLMASDTGLVGRLAGLVLVAAIAVYIGFLPALNRLAPRLPGGRAVCKACSIIIPSFVGVLYVSLARINLIPSGIVVSVVFWSLFMAVVTTGIVLSLGAEPEVPNFWAPGVWQTFTVAQAEAVRFRHDFIGTEHLLLGLLQVEGSSVRKVLSRTGVSAESVRAEIEKFMGSGAFGLAGGGEPRCTPRAQKAFQLATREAQICHTQRADTEHLFLGLIREGSGIAARVLSALGVDVQTARREILDELAKRKNRDE
ncbi:MAG TPA: Clp protease N-terminal domain-containing protein [Candidatus Angelobacter sp.]|nr:Clp protease N-terminal domain-containing protein [Candidatus Angelobacter sp.]